MNKLQEEISAIYTQSNDPRIDLYSLISDVALKFALWRDTECVESIKNDFEYFVRHIYK